MPKLCNYRRSTSIWGSRPNFYYCQLWGCWRGELWREEGVYRLQLLLGLTSAVVFGSESSGTHNHILLSQIWDSPNLEGQVPVFTSPTNSYARLYPQAMGWLFVVSYDSQGYGGGIRTRLHSELHWLSSSKKSPRLGSSYIPLARTVDKTPHCLQMVQHVSIVTPRVRLLTVP
jgi:hypothetical protein